MTDQERRELARKWYYIILAEEDDDEGHPIAAVVALIRTVEERVHSDGFKAGVEGKAELLAACKKMRLSANSPDPQDWADGLSEIDAAILAAEPKEDTP